LKIRRKLPKPPRSKPPLYVIGFSAPPIQAEFQTWFDLEYGGPLSCKSSSAGDDPAGSIMMMTHGPWTSWVQWSVPSAQADAWQHRLEWGHSSCSAVGAASSTRSNTMDVMLHTARVARGLTLLTGGTAYDVATATYLNPSDWTDRPLTRFNANDHVTVVQSDDSEHRREWFYTRGLSKFGIDEVEVFQPIGLPSPPILEKLYGIAEELIRNGHSPTVGSSVTIQHLALSVRIVRHRTHPSTDMPLILREVSW